MAFGAPPQGLGGGGGGDAYSALLVDYARIVDTVYQVFGYEPAVFARRLLLNGGRVLAAVLAKPPTGYIGLETSANAAGASVDRDYDDVILSGYSTDGYDAKFVWWFWDVSGYDEILFCAQLVPLGDSRGPGLCLGSDLNNRYHVSVDVGAASQDFYLVKVYGGSSSALAAEAVDLSLNTPQRVCWLYVASSGEHMVWRNGVRKFDVIDLDVPVAYAGYFFWTRSTTTTTRRIRTPIILLAYGSATAATQTA